MLHLTPHGHTALIRVYVDDVWVGLGLARDCQPLVDELRDDPDKADWLKGIMRDRLAQGVLELTPHSHNHGA